MFHMDRNTSTPTGISPGFLDSALGFTFDDDSSKGGQPGPLPLHYSFGAGNPNPNTLIAPTAITPALVPATTAPKQPGPSPEPSPDTSFGLDGLIEDLPRLSPPLDGLNGSSNAVGPAGRFGYSRQAGPVINSASGAVVAGPELDELERHLFPTLNSPDNGLGYGGSPLAIKEEPDLLFVTQPAGSGHPPPPPSASASGLDATWLAAPAPTPRPYSPTLLARRPLARIDPKSVTAAAIQAAAAAGVSAEQIAHYQQIWAETSPDMLVHYQGPTGPGSIGLAPVKTERMALEYSSWADKESSTKVPERFADVSDDLLATIDRAALDKLMAKEKFSEAKQKEIKVLRRKLKNRRSAKAAVGKKKKQAQSLTTSNSQLALTVGQLQTQNVNLTQRVAQLEQTVVTARQVVQRKDAERESYMAEIARLSALVQSMEMERQNAQQQNGNSVHQTP